MDFAHASSDDAVSLRDLERAANLAALGHVFPPERFPYPGDDVLARWSLVLEEPGVTTLVARDDEGEPVAVVAYDAGCLRHLAVRPNRWGTGVARAAVERAVSAMRERGAETLELWCLVENRRARGLYEHLGWRAAADRQEAPWPPHPTEMRYLLPGAARCPRSDPA